VQVEAVLVDRQRERRLVGRLLAVIVGRIGVRQGRDLAAADGRGVGIRTMGGGAVARLTSSASHAAASGTTSSRCSTSWRDAR
jgi:hypothetical protein